MGETIIEKIIRHNTGKAVKPGDIVTVNVDRVMIHDIFIPFVAEKFEEMGFTKLHDPDKVVLIYDHLVPASQVMLNREILHSEPTAIPQLMDVLEHFHLVSVIPRWQVSLEPERCGSRYRRRSKL